MTQEQQDRIGRALAELHTMLQQADKKLWELEALFVEAARGQDTDS